MQFGNWEEGYENPRHCSFDLVETTNGNEDFLRNIGFKIEDLGIDNFVVELKRGMIQYNITDEESIQMFLANCMVETGGTDLLEINKNNGDAGSGLIQVTGEAQYRFLKMVLARYEEGSPEWEEIKAICRDFEDANGNYVGYNSTNNSGVTPKDYIAEHYPIESAVWF